jgi:hypothetical protein
MTNSASLRLAGVAAAYLLWLVSYFVLGDLAFGPEHHYWAESAVVAVSAVLAFRASRTLTSPYPLFLMLLGVGLAALILTSATYDQHPPLLVPGFSCHNAPEIWAVSYAAFLFLWSCAWGYLGVERWCRHPPSALTVVVFTVLTLGLAGFAGTFYFGQYADDLSFVPGRLDATIAGLEFASLAVALACVLLGVPGALTWMVLAMAVLVSIDMLYTVSVYQTGAMELAWMSGLFLILASLVALPQSAARFSERLAPQGEAVNGRSGLSGVLLLLSVGTVLLVAGLGLLPQTQPDIARSQGDGTAWKDFFSVLFLVALVATMVWITDRFDEALDYLKAYASRLHQRRLEAEPWRQAAPRLRAMLHSTGLGRYLDALGESAARLRRDVLFLGPDRFYPPPKGPSAHTQTRCFIVMPFSLAWSGDVHGLLSDACRAAGVQPERGDDLFTPTDILNDIWQGINGADFVIADITDKNPNVLYELGIAHTLAKPVLILSRNAEDIPIDLATRRVILYGRSKDTWREDLDQQVSRAIEEILQTYSLTRRRARVGEPSDGDWLPADGETAKIGRDRDDAGEDSDHTTGSRKAQG